MHQTPPTVVIVPGLRDDVADHWQTLLAARLPRVSAVRPMGREDLQLTRRVAAIEEAVQSIDGPVVLVAHSGGVITTVHWAHTTQRPVVGALLATPPDFDTPMPAGYPSVDALRAYGWVPVPCEPLPFASIVAASRNDPLGTFERVESLAKDWGSQVADLGEVGHLNPASGYGDWPQAEEFIRYLSAKVDA